MSMTKETWKEVPGWNGRYLVSDLGKVVTVPFIQIDKTGRRYSIEQKSRKFYPDKDGYLTIVLCKDGRMMYRGVHQLVMNAFIGMPPDGMQVNHKDGNKSNNHLGNLEYVTRSENHLHRCRILGHGRGESNGRSKLTESKVREIRKLYADGVSCAAIGRLYGVTAGVAWRVGNKKTWIHVTD